MRIVPLAVKNYFLYGTPIQDTIKNHNDIYDFCLRLKTNSNSTGMFIHLVDGEIVTDTLARTTRYYVSRSSKAGSLVKDFGNKRISGVNVGYSVMLFNKIKRRKLL